MTQMRQSVRTVCKPRGPCESGTMYALHPAAAPSSRTDTREPRAVTFTTRFRVMIYAEIASALFYYYYCYYNSYYCIVVDLVKKDGKKKKKK